MHKSVSQHEKPPPKVEPKLVPDSSVKGRNGGVRKSITASPRTKIDPPTKQRIKPMDGSKPSIPYSIPKKPKELTQEEKFAEKLS